MHTYGNRRSKFTYFYNYYKEKMPNVTVIIISPGNNGNQRACNNYVNIF